MDSTVNAQQKRSRWTILRVGLLLLVGVGVLSMIGGRRPENLGVDEGKLALCPDKPNCVSTQAATTEQQIDPLRMESDLDAVTLAARNAIEDIPRAKFVTQQPDYCHVECTSLVCRFVDDLELWIDTENRLVHARSASRVGYSDLGINRKRVEQIFDAMVNAGVASRIDPTD